MKSSCKDKYQQGIFLTLIFLGQVPGTYEILENEFFTGRIFKFLNKSNHNYFQGNDVFNVFESLMTFLKVHFQTILTQNG